MDLEEELEELEDSFEETEKEFKQVRDKSPRGEASEKQVEAEKLIKEIRGQLEFLRDQVNQSK